MTKTPDDARTCEETRRTKCANRTTDPGKLDSGSQPIALIPHARIRFSSIVSIRTGAVAKGHGNFRRFAGRFDGQESDCREGTSSPQSSISGHEVF
jgi:hypothetical protein